MYTAKNNNVLCFLFKIYRINLVFYIIEIEKQAIEITICYSNSI